MTTKLTSVNIDTTTITEVGNLANLTVSNSIFIGNSTFTEEKIFPFNLVISPEVLTINVDAPDAGNDITWKFTWTTSSLPYSRVPITNSPQPIVPMYKQGTYQVNNFANEIHGNMTQMHKLYLKWIDGAGLDNLVSWASNVGNVSFSHPDINGGANTTVQRLNISVPASITLPTLVAPNVAYNVAATTSDVYTFSNMGVGDNRGLGPFYRGGTYTFNLDTSLGDDNKFYLTTDNGTGFIANSYVGEYTSGVTGSRGNGAVGYNTLTFVVPQDAPDTLFYQSANVSSRRGTITIKDLAVETNVNGNYVLYFQHMKEGHKTPVEIKPIPSMVNQMCVVYDATSGQFVPQDLATYVDNTPSFKNKIQEVAGTATLVAPSGVPVVPTVSIVEDASYLSFVNNKEGDISYASDTQTLYIWDNNAWKNTKTGTQPNLTVTGNVSLGSIANVHINGGTNGQYVKTDGNGNLSFTTVTVPDPLHPFLLGGM